MRRARRALHDGWRGSGSRGGLRPWRAQPRRDRSDVRGTARRGTGSAAAARDGCLASKNYGPPEAALRGPSKRNISILTESRRNRRMDVTAGPTLTEELTAVEHDYPGWQIGRASCRERV